MKLGVKSLQELNQEAATEVFTSSKKYYQSTHHLSFVLIRSEVTAVINQVHNPSHLFLDSAC